MNVLAHLVFLSLVFSCVNCVIVKTETASGYKFTLERLNDQMPLIYPSLFPSDSSFDYNYNPAYVPVFDSNGILKERKLLVRCQQNTSELYNPPNTYATSPSVLALTDFTYSPTDATSSPINFAVKPITNSSVVFGPEMWYETLGTEDPRVIYREKTGTYYMHYSAVQDIQQPPGSGVNVRLSLATAKDPNNWIRHGPIFKDNNGTQWSKSGALLCRDGYPGPHYLFYGDSGYVPGLQVALSEDMIHYVSRKDIWLPIRSNSFDSYLVESGPMPLQLSNGQYLFIYNSARHGFPSSKPGYDLQYNVGWVILDEEDPTMITERCSNPILSPELAWEVGVDSLVPNVVFVEGWEQVDVNKFIMYYGGSDTAVGAALLTVEVPK